MLQITLINLLKINNDDNEKISEVNQSVQIFQIESNLVDRASGLT